MRFLKAAEKEPGAIREQLVRRFTLRLLVLSPTQLTAWIEAATILTSQLTNEPETWVSPPTGALNYPSSAPKEDEVVKSLFNLVIFMKQKTFKA